MRKLMSFEDLYDFYSSAGTSLYFKAKDDDANIVIGVDGIAKFDVDSNPTEGLAPVTLWSCHTLLNRNHSNIEQDVMEAALPSFSNRPILGFIHEVNGEEHFWSHNMHQGDDGEIIYDEIPIGHILESCNAHLEHDEEKQRDYVVVDGCLYDGYTHAPQILEREGECPVSVELTIRELEFNAKEKYLDIKDFFFSGVTILGKTPEGDDVEPGMEGAHITLLNSKVLPGGNPDDIENFQEGGKNEVSKFEELLEKYGKTEEDIDFEHADMTDDELEVKFAEMFEEDDGGEGSDPEGSAGGDDDDDPVEEFSKTFSISHEDIKTALYGLLSVFEESDNEWYWISAVYDNYFAYEGLFGGAIYGQNYATDGDNVSFDGERYSLHRELLTDSEYAQLQDMRANYAQISEKLAKYEEEPKKIEILESVEYTQISDVPEFIALKEMENHFDLTVEEVSNKADEILLNYAKSTKLDFAVTADGDKKKVTSKHMPQITKKTGRYGNLFSK